MPFDLSLAECVRLNDDLQKAMKAKESPALIDIMTEIKASDTKNKLKVRVRAAAAAERGPTIFPLFPLLFSRSRLTAYMNKHTLFLRSLWPIPSSVRPSPSSPSIRLTRPSRHWLVR